MGKIPCATFLIAYRIINLRQRQKTFHPQISDNSSNSILIPFVAFSLICVNPIYSKCSTIFGSITNFGISL